MQDDDKPSLTADDLALVPAGEGEADDKGAGDDGKAAADGKGKADTKAAAEADDGADPDEGDDDGDAGDDASDKEGDDEGEESGSKGLADELGEDDEADDKKAEAKDGKKAADKEEGDKSKDPGKQAWSTRRDEITKEAEAKWLKKAKTPEEQKAVASRVGALRKTLARYGTEQAYLLANIEAQEKLRARTEDVVKPGADASPEEVAEYKEKKGLPVEAKAYDIPAVAGHKWTENDKPTHDKFKQAAFDLDLTQAAVDRLTHLQVELGKEAVERQGQAIAALDKSDKKEAKAALMEDFGEEYGDRLAVLDKLVKDEELFPDGVGEMLWNARDPNSGKRLVYNASYVKFLTNAALDIYGDGVIQSGDVREASNTRRKELQDILRTDRDRYFREGLDKEYQDIVAKEERSRTGRRGRAA